MLRGPDGGNSLSCRFISSLGRVSRGREAVQNFLNKANKQVKNTSVFPFQDFCACSSFMTTWVIRTGRNKAELHEL